MQSAIFENLLPALEDFGSELDVIELSGDATDVERNSWTDTRETIEIGGKSHQFNVRYAFRDPILSSGILRKTITDNSPNGRIDFNATIVSHMDLQVQIDDQWMDIGDFAVRAIQAASAGAAKLSREDILNILAQYHWNPTARYPMYLQHLGAGPKEYNDFAQHFLSIGAEDNTEDVRKRARGKKSEVLQSVRHKVGVPVQNMELSKADRSRSQNNSGFIGFLDARWNTLQHVLAAHQQRLAAKHILNDANASEADRNAAAKIEMDLKSLFQDQVRTRAFRNWGGTTVSKDVLEDTRVTYYAQQVPCGRLSVVVDGKVHPYSVWTQANRTEATDAATTAVGETLAAAVEASTF